MCEGGYDLWTNKMKRYMRDGHSIVCKSTVCWYIHSHERVVVTRTVVIDNKDDTRKDLFCTRSSLSVYVFCRMVDNNPASQIKAK